MARRIRNEQVDYLVLAVAILLVVLGLAALASASSDLGKLKFDDAYYYLKHQSLYGLILGLAGFLIGYRVNYHRYKKLALIFLIASLAALILVFSPLGFSSGGAQRWLQLGPVTFQPSEFLKIFFIGYLAAWLGGGSARRGKSWREGFWPFLVIAGLIGFLLLLQRSTSAAAILMATAMTMYFVSGARHRHIFAAITLGLLLLTAFIVATPYRLERVKTFINREGAVEQASYQLNQALIIIGSGGVKGVGYGQSAAKSYLPERIGDSIFAVIAEEFGFIGSLGIILLFLTLVARLLILARRCSDGFGKLLLVGFGTIIGIQSFVHIGANSGVIPLTGVPLPFISYGGTSLAVFMTMIGISLNISKSVRK